ncbi:MAG: PriCT-2 domain-containing protein, partial [Selenomonadaceae bacterium]|nr:PriCT-2 domain-containing protein [Selenomonadaceae bacterium]
MAKGFLPFPVSMLVYSGQGLHPYCLYAKPITITAENRSEVTKRNKKFIDTIRSRAGKYVKAVDSVHDLPRVLRMPGTYNYKGGKENAPLCRLIEVSDVRFTPESLDAQLNELQPAKKSTQKKSKQSSSSSVYQNVDDRDRAFNMLATIPVADLSRDEWLHVGMALKNNGNTVSDWGQWSRADERFKEGECEKLWQGFNGTGLTIATIHDIAKRYGYQEPSKPNHSNHSNHSDETGSETVVRTRDRITDCPVNLILPENFIWTRKGITQLVPSKKKDRDFDYFPVTATPIIITREFCEPIKHRTEYEIAMLLRGKWIRSEVDGKTLTEARLLAELGNYGAIINEVGRLKKFFDALRACNPDLPQVAVYKQTGWTSDDFK